MYWYTGEIDSSSLQIAILFQFSCLRFLFAALLTIRAEGLRPLHLLQIFAGLGFSGFSSYRKSIPEVASSHMVLIAFPRIFSPADFAGSETVRTAQRGPGQ